MSQLLKLDTPDTKTFTHYKIASIKIESPRPYLLDPKVGFIDIWIAKSNIIDGIVVEVQGEPGININISGSDFDSLMAELVNVTTLGCIEDEIVRLMQERGYMPSGVLEVPPNV